MKIFEYDIYQHELSPNIVTLLGFPHAVIKGRFFES